MRAWRTRVFRRRLVGWRAGGEERLYGCFVVGVLDGEGEIWWKAMCDGMLVVFGIGFGWESVVLCWGLFGCWVSNGTFADGH
jgi:hypothetical protein